MGDNISTVGIASVLWRVFNTSRDNISTSRGYSKVGDNISTVEGTVGDTFSTVWDNIITVEVAQYSGDTI